MKKALVILMAVAMLIAMTSMAFALQGPNKDGNTPAKGNIVANTYTPVASDSATGKNYGYYEQGKYMGYDYGVGSLTTSTHVYGTWNSPYTAGVDGYNYNDSQDYVETGTQKPNASGDFLSMPVAMPFYGDVGTYFDKLVDEMFAGGVPTGKFSELFSQFAAGNIRAFSDAAGTVPWVPHAFGGAAGPLALVKTRVANNFQSGPHGGYLTSTHRCRECHAVHRAAGKFKLLRSDTRFEACDWCHGTGAGSGYNIQMDNNDIYTTEYNVGHTMGYGIDSGKWKAPDDTYPAFTPNYYMGGFSCFDCHSPHANPQRMLGYNNAGQAVGLPGDAAYDQGGKIFGIANPGHSVVQLQLAVGAKPTDGSALINENRKQEVVYLSGSWLLIKDPDKEMADENTAVPGGIYSPNPVSGQPPILETNSVSLFAGQEIPDSIVANVTHWTDGNYYPVNKMPTDWDSPVGPAGSAEVGKERVGYNVRQMSKRIWNVSEFCADCHDGNAGLHTVGAPLYSEDRALRGQGGNSNTTDLTSTAYNWKGNYDVAYGHDAAPRH